jgi:hypothetical protein
MPLSSNHDPKHIDDVKSCLVERGFEVPPDANFISEFHSYSRLKDGTLVDEQRASLSNQGGNLAPGETRLGTRFGAELRQETGGSQEDYMEGKINNST